MKVAIVIHRADVSLGGAERSVFELAAELTSLGARVELVAAKGKQSDQHVHILAGGGKSASVFAFGAAVRAHLACHSYDVVHSVLPFSFADVYQPRGGAYAEAAIRHAASYGGGLVSAYKRVTAFANLRRLALMRAERSLCSKPDGPMVAALSKYVKRQFQTHYHLPESRLAVIHNGVGPVAAADAATLGKLSGQLRDKLAVKQLSDVALLVFAAHNFRLKGLTALLKALGLVNHTPTARPAYLIVVGRDKPHKYRLLARRLGIERKVVFLGPMPEIHPILALADAAVLPTYYDPCSRFILEALALARPVITTGFNGAAEMFTNQRHGIVIDEPDDIAGLANAITYFCNSENVQRASQAIVQDNLRDKISIGRHARELLAVFKSIVSGKRRT
jgi:UDP-glucose:(heptosyl)LPS alpha-1,3-glucosyltransferase